MSHQDSSPKLPWTIRTRLWPLVTSWLWLLAAVASTIALAWLALAERLSAPAYAAVLLAVVAAPLAVRLARRPLAYTFGRDRIAVRSLASTRRMDPATLDSIAGPTGTDVRRLVLRFADGSRLIVQQDDLGVSLEEVEHTLRQLLAPLAVLSPWPREQRLNLPPTVFGPGSRRPFAHYLEGSSLSLIHI